VRRIPILAVFFAIAACSSEDTPDASVADAGPHASPGVCRPDPTGTGNELNVGAYCSPGGDECGAFEEAPLCAIDLDPEGDRFCIRVGCDNHEECGSQACCTGRVETPTKACVPKGCLTEDDLTKPCPPIPYPDGGSGDGSTQDGSG
jgi:hypothetical protein